MKRTIMDYPPELRTNNHEVIFARGREKGRAKMKLLAQERIRKLLCILQQFKHPCPIYQMAEMLGCTEKTIRKYVKTLEGYVIKDGLICEMKKMPSLRKE